MQTVISFRAENLCWLNTLYCFVAVNTRHPSVWLVVDLQSISESSIYSLQQKDCFLMSSLWMKGVCRLVPFSDTVPEISTVYWSQSRETRELLTASALPAPAKQTDYTLSLHHLWNICALFGLNGAVKIIQMCTTFLVPSICLLGIILGCPAICYLLMLFLSVFTEIVGHKRCFKRPQIL